MQNNLIDNLTNISNSYKTISMGLEPIGETLNFILKNNVIEIEEERKIKYDIVKNLIDKYHKDFINNTLFNLNLDFLNEYFSLYIIQKRNNEQKERLNEIINHIINQISSAYTLNPRFKDIFSDKMIKEYLFSVATTDEEIDALDAFKRFATYFKPFNDKRKFIYSNSGKVGTIANRIVNENLPKFLNNILLFKKILNTPLSEKIIEIEDGLIDILNSRLDDIFTVDFFNNVLTQNGIDNYNYIIGGYSIDGEKKIKGVNEYINEYNQSVEKKDRIGKLKPLYKQILNDVVKISKFDNKFDSDVDLFNYLLEYNDEIETLGVYDKIINTISSIDNCDLNTIYLTSKSINDLSKKIYGDWSIIQSGLNLWYETEFYSNKQDKIGTTKFLEGRNKYFKNQESYSITFLEKCISDLDIDTLKDKSIVEYIKNEIHLIDNVITNYKKIVSVLKNPKLLNRPLKNNESFNEKIKSYCDSLKELERFIKIFNNNCDEIKDDLFYSELDILFPIINQITTLYNKVQKYILSTVKLYSKEKINLCFDLSEFGGWDPDKERAYGTVLLRKDGTYYLGVVNKCDPFSLYEEQESDSYYERAIIKNINEPYKQLIRILFSKARIDFFNPSQQILDIKNKNSYTQGPNFNIDDLHIFIDYIKDCLNKHPEWSEYFDYKFKNTKEYTSINDFYSDADECMYHFSFKNISKDYVDALIKEGKLYLFKIYNKDSSKNSKGKKDLFTIYWESIFSEENMKNPKHKLTSKGLEVFFRKSSIKSEDIIIHKKNEAIKNKNINNPKNESVFSYDIIKDKRFTVDQFMVHIPIILNYKYTSNVNINEIVNNEIKKQDDFYVIGIDRGERNLIYYTVINSNQEIIEQKSLNVIYTEYNGIISENNYHKSLTEREKERMNARLSWKEIQNISDKKNGYMSIVIHQITQLLLKYPNSIISIEDLNSGFKKSRTFIEKQVYQNFEHSLYNKLAYLVIKNRYETEAGGVLNGYQLSNPFSEEVCKYRQNGLVFKIPAWNTSNIDPTTGFVNYFNTNYESIKKSIIFFSSFDSIKYNKCDDYFEFSFDYNNFTKKAENTKTNWIVCSYGERIRNTKNENGIWLSEVVNPTKLLKKLFIDFDIDYNNISDIKSLICEQSDSKFFKSLLYYFKLVLQLRNSETNSDIDYLLSPIKNTNGVFFDSRNSDNTLPKDADANGAFNIARKGLMYLNLIKKCDDLKTLKLNITDKEWLSFAQNN